MPVEKVRVLLSEGMPPINKVDLLLKRSVTGAEIYTPKNGDQCFDSPVPCTPYFNENIKINNRENGFPRIFFSK